MARVFLCALVEESTDVEESKAELADLNAGTTFPENLLLRR
jgi:hypothetical protein